jgi:hypothetical protein
MKKLAFNVDSIVGEIKGVKVYKKMVFSLVFSLAKNGEDEQRRKTSTWTSNHNPLGIETWS